MLIKHNRMEKGPRSESYAAAISIGEEGVKQPTPSMVVKDNVFTNNTGYTTPFVRNITVALAYLSRTSSREGASTFGGGWVARLEVRLEGWKARLHHMAGAALRRLR